jgi:hypothetical protein
MNARAFLLVGTLLASTAWSQEPAFDLKSESVRNIVRATAASQSVALPESPAAPVRTEPAKKTVAFVPPEKPPLVRELTAEKPRDVKLNPFLSAVVDTVVDETLGVEPDPGYEFEYEKLRNCQRRNADKTSTERDAVCSSGPRAWTVNDQPTIVRPRLR